MAVIAHHELRDVSRSAPETGDLLQQQFASASRSIVLQAVIAGIVGASPSLDNTQDAIEK